MIKAEINGSEVTMGVGGTSIELIMDIVLFLDSVDHAIKHDKKGNACVQSTSPVKKVCRKRTGTAKARTI